jgi:hydrogenase expression/formation protein HypE
VNAMHDPTEGGIAGGINEMADASNLGVRVYEEKIKVLPETMKICNYFQIDPLQLIGSGALLIAARSENAKSIIRNLERQQIHASIIGEFLENPCERLFIRKNRQKQDLPRPTTDSLWRALARD